MTGAYAHCPANIKDMVDDDIVNLAKNIDQEIKPDNITLLQGGFSSQAYKVAPKSGNPFVLLVERKGAVSRSDYGLAYVIYTLLKKHSFKHSPDPLWLSDDHSALAISYFDGFVSNEFDFAGLDKEQLATQVIDSLLDTAAISLEEYKQLASEFNVTQNPIETSKEGARMYGIEWLEIVKRSCPDQDIINWLETRVERSVRLINQAPEHKPTFGHGDPSNPNILFKANGDFMLIDWGSARFHTSGPEFFVAYTTHLTDFMGPYRETLIKHVAERLNIPIDEFRDRVNNFRMCSEVFDVNWAAMMMAKINAKETDGDINNFRNIAHERIRLYEEDFG